MQVLYITSLNYQYLKYCYSFHFADGGAETQKCGASGRRSPSWEGAELGFELRGVWLRAWAQHLSAALLSGTGGTRGPDTLK